jgi:hypothetical protein
MMLHCDRCHTSAEACLQTFPVPQPHLLCVLCQQQHVCLAACKPLHLLPQLLQPLLAALLHCSQPAVNLAAECSSN